MILKIKRQGNVHLLESNRPAQMGRAITDGRPAFRPLFLLAICLLLMAVFNFATCKYSFKDTSPIPPEVKTFRVNYFENKARYVNPQLSPQLTEAMKQKVIGNTRLRQTNDDNAHYDISGY